MNPTQLKHNIIIPVLEYLHPHIPFSNEAVDLLMMTCAHESLMGTSIHQLDGGVAQGVYQMEPRTEEDIYLNYLKYRVELELKLLRLTPDEVVCPNLYNPIYSTAMARVHYYRVPEPLPRRVEYVSPNGEDLVDEYRKALASYAKKYYNTELGAATAEDYYRDYLALAF